VSSAIVPYYLQHTAYEVDVIKAAIDGPAAKQTSIQVQLNVYRVMDINKQLTSRRRAHVISTMHRQLFKVWCKFEYPGLFSRE